MQITKESAGNTVNSVNFFLLLQLKKQCPRDTGL